MATTNYATLTTLSYFKGKLKTFFEGIFAKKEDVPSTYAGSSTAGGSATSAAKLDTASAGAANKPVYFDGGVPVSGTYELNRDVPADAVFTDTTYSNASSAAAGLMSTADFDKLAGVEAQANKTVVDDAIADGGTNPVTGDAIHDALAGKASLSGAAFTGEVTATTPSAGDESTKVATTEFVKNAVSAAVGSVYTVKGSVATYEDLPSTGRKTGDVYNVVAAHGDVPAGTNYVFDGSKWDELGGPIDLSGYVQSGDIGAISDAEIDTLFA